MRSHQTQLCLTLSPLPEVLRTIETAYPEKHWEQLPMMLPDWKTIRAYGIGKVPSYGACS